MPTTEGYINQFLPTHKVSSEEASGKEADTAERIIYGRLSSAGFPTHLWTDLSDTPDLLKSIIGMRVAGMIYARLYSETDARTATYGRYLIEQADRLVTNIVDGTLKLEGQEFEVGITGGIDETEPVFTIGRVF